jgi:osmotically-inducible protein OsmY
VKIKTTHSAVLIMSVVALLVASMPVYASEMEDRIELSARKSYVFRTYLGGDDIKIQSKDGAVTLTGTVSEESHKALAYETVAGLPGVKSVDNKLGLKSTPPAENSDEWLREKVKATLLFHQSVNARKTEVYVKDGIVTLRGEAATQARKELTTEYAKDIEGVKDVNNEMTVSMPPMPSMPPISTKTTVGEDIDDASTTAQVKISLLYHRSTSALNTKVETNKGVVTLYGKAKNAAEKDLATKLANDINGVKSVMNRMTIE